MTYSPSNVIFYAAGVLAVVFMLWVLWKFSQQAKG